MNDTDLAKTAITSIIVQVVISEAIKDNQHEKDPGPTPEDQ